VILLIDATTIRAGGGLVHLNSILKFYDQANSKFSKICVAAPSATLKLLVARDQVTYYQHELIDNGGYYSLWKWRKFNFYKLLEDLNWPVLFCAGTIAPPFRYPYYTICQNLLPLQFKELFRYGFSFVTLRLLMLRMLHLNAYKNAQGVIFLTQYSFDVLPKRYKEKIKNFAVIPHGVDHLAFKPLEPKRDENPCFRIIYVSVIDQYKHQDKVAQAVINLNVRNVETEVIFIGPAYSPSLKKLNHVIQSHPNASKWIRYIGQLSQQQQVDEYAKSDLCLIASSCESFGMILTESMALGMPIVCSTAGSLMEIAGDAALYFNPTEISSIEEAIEKAIKNSSLRLELSKKALKRAKNFSWESTSKKTFEFLSRT
jgi:glycosyltransferase involved in cell wall biosynthesis